MAPHRKSNVSQAWVGLQPGQAINVRLLLLAATVFGLKQVRVYGERNTLVIADEYEVKDEPCFRFSDVYAEI